MTTDAPPGSGQQPKWRFLIAVGVVACWFGFLALLTVTTANPVTVNRQQLLSSDAIVVGEFGEASSRGSTLTLRVNETLAGRDVPSSLSVEGVETARIAGGGSFIVPLRRSGSDYLVTPAPEAFNGARLVYPATDEVREAVEEVLILHSPKPYR